jgi:SP family sugar:H+ symporter-like MFS transporter
MPMKGAIADIRSQFNRTLLLTVSLAALSSFNYGFDNQGFAATIAMNGFEQQFGWYDAKTGTYSLKPYFLSLLNSLNYIGFAVGLIVGSIISSRFGRRACIFSLSCYALFSATVVITSKSRGQILAGRILNYVYVGMELSVIPVFQAEMAPPRLRGFLVGTYQCSLLLGGVIINIICNSTSSLDDNRSWRIPTGLYYVIPTIVGSCVWFVPESPRWLLVRGYDDDALVSLRRIRRAEISDDDTLLELMMIKSEIESEKEKGTYADLFKGVNLKRTVIAVGVNFFQQATGQSFASQYGAIFVKSIGTISPFKANIGLSATNTFMCLVCLTLNDKLGRRTLLLTGASVQLIALLCMGGLGTDPNPSYSIKSAIIAMLYLMSAGFSVGWAPLTYVVTTEIPALKLRDKTQRVASLVNIATQFLVTFSLPYLLSAPYANLESKVGFIYAVVALCAIVFTYYAVPECKGRSLEDVDYMFNSGVSIRSFSSFIVPQERTLSQLEKQIVEYIP